MVKVERRQSRRTDVDVIISLKSLMKVVFLHVPGRQWMLMLLTYPRVA